MAASLPRPAQNVSAGAIHEQAIEHRLDARELRGDVLPQPLVVAQLLRLHAPHDPLRPLHQLVQLAAGAQAQVPEPLEELVQVLDGRVTEDLGPSRPPRP
jgi:hypothetical protein